MARLKGLEGELRKVAADLQRLRSIRQAIAGSHPGDGQGDSAGSAVPDGGLAQARTA